MKPTILNAQRLLFLMTALILCFGTKITVNAASKEIQIHNKEALSDTLFVGGTGKIIPIPDIPESTGENNDTPSVSGNASEKVSGDASEKVSGDASEKASGDATENIPKITYSFSTWDSNILTIDSSTGEYSAVALGTTTVYISGIDENGIQVFNASITFTINIDMANVTLVTDTVTAYLSPYYYNKKPTYNGEADFAVALNSTTPITLGEYDYDSLQYSSSNPEISVTASITENIINIQADSKKGGSTILTLTIYGKPFTIYINLVPLKISQQSYMLVKKKSVKLTISGYNGPITWTSSNPKVATVDKNGVVKGKALGNTIIKAKVGDVYLGCVVSVTTKQLKKVVARASYIGTHWKYSQPKRTLKGYYDCSALVWKAYTQYTNINFGSRGYPGVALSEAKWCKAHGKMIKGGLTYKKLNRLQVNPGDLLFKSTDPKHPYKDIYHVEMFTGYYCHGVDSTGRASISINWAARGSYYSFEEKSLLGRPITK